MAVIGEIITRLGFTGDSRPADQYAKSLDGAEKSGRSMAKTMGTAVVAGIAAVGKAAVSAGRQLVSLTVDFARVGDEVAKTGKKIGVSTRDLQRLRYAAQLNGASTAALDAGLRRLQVSLGDALSRPTGAAAQALDRLGLSASDLADMDAEDQLVSISEAMKGLDSDAERARASVDLLGRGGQELGVLLAQGGAGIRAAGDEAERLGGVMGEDALAGAESLTDTFLRFETITQGLKNSLGSALAPAFAKIGDRVAELVSENDDFIQQDLPDLIVTIADALIELIPWVVDVIKEFRNFYTEIKNLVTYVQEEFPGAWEAAGAAMGLILSPMEKVRTLALLVIDAIESVIGKSERLRGVAASLGLVSTDGGVSGIAGAAQRAGAQGVTIGLGDDAPGAQAKIANVTPDRSVESLQGVLSDPLSPPSAKAKAQALLPQAQAREARADAERQFREQESRGRASTERRNQRAALAAEEGVNKPRRRGGGGRRRKATDKTEDIFEDLEGAPAQRRELLGGAQVVRVDASYRPTITVAVEKIETDATDMDGTVTDVSEEISRRLQDQIRPLYDHYQEALRP